MPADAPLLFAWLNVPTAWLFVGAGLALATIGLVSLLRSRWRYVKAWKKCALLSLWVHILLAYGATVVQIASGGLGIGPGEGFGPPIQVALVTTEITPLNEVSALVVEESPAETEPVAPELVEAEDDVPEEESPTTEESSTDAEPPSIEAPDLLREPVPTPEPAKVEAEAPAPAIDDTEEPPAESPAIEEPDAAPMVEEPATPKPPKSEPPKPLTTAVADVGAPSKSSDASKDVAKTQAASTTPAAPVPDAYADRFAANRSQLVAGGGGNADTEQAVRAALVWLAAAQSDDGRWDAKRHGAGQERYAVLGQQRGSTGAKADNAVTGLALLTFLGAGHSHREGPYSTEVARGLDYLRRSQGGNGNLCGEAELFAQTYCHSMASFAVGEALALTKDERLEPIVRAAASYSLALQHPTDGGWRYRPGDTGDTSQLGWQVMSVRSAELGGLEVPDATWTRVERFLRRVERGQAGGLAVYRPEEALPSRSMTAEAMYCRQLTTGRPDGGFSAAALDEAINSLVKELPSTRQINLYYWYYATLALHRAQHASPQAADAWRRWNEALTQTLLATQQEDGSWPATCVWGGYGGRVYTTSLAAMCLEVYYRYAPDGGNEPLPYGSDVARRGVDAWK
jgi:hypothetical protein